MLGVDSNTSGHGQADFCPFSYSQTTRTMSFWSLYPSFKNCTVSLLRLKSTSPLVCYMFRVRRWRPAQRRQSNRFSSSMQEHGKRNRGQWERKVRGCPQCLTHCRCSLVWKSWWRHYGSSLPTMASEEGAGSPGNTLEHTQCPSTWKCTDRVTCWFFLVNIPNEPVNCLEMPVKENALE